MVASTCNWNFIMQHFKFLKTVVGRGVFNLFVASMCLVGEETSLLSYAMFVGLVICGLFYVLIGCACLKGYSEVDKEADKALQAKAV